MKDAVSERMSTREKFQARSEAQLTSWGRQLAELDGHTRLNANYDVALSEWKLAIAKLNELKTATGDRWGAIKNELERTYRAIAAALGGSAAGVVSDGEETRE